MFGIGIIEIFIVLMVALFVIGPDKIPEAARSLGRFFRTIRQYMNEIKRSVNGDAVMTDLRDQIDFDIPELMPEEDEDEALKEKRKIDE